METTSKVRNITRKEAEDRFDISDRTLGRYLKKAMLKRDAEFLKHFKLVMLDGEEIEGPTVTLELIDDLQSQSRVPTWMISIDWLEKTFDPRSAVTASQAEQATKPTALLYRHPII